MQLLAVLAVRAADVLADYGRPSPQLEAWQFVTALERCLSDRRVHRLAASLAVVWVAIPEAAATIVELSAERRAHDRTWLTSADDGEALLLILLPLTALEGGQCFARRLQDLMRARYGQLSGFSVSVREIQPDDSVDTLIAFTRDSRENRAPARPPAGLRRS